MNIIIAPDSFKGTLSAQEVCEIISHEFHAIVPETNITCIPLADGGEGMAEAWQAACGGAMRESTVSGPFGEPVRARWLLLGDGTAVLETAACAGLELARPQGLNPARATTRGVGELMLAAQAAGARRILLGLGGSATNDAGCGMATALGWKFLDVTGLLFCPVGEILCEVDRIYLSVKTLKIPVVAACDVTNPLYGPNGAAYIFAPQKGAGPAMTRKLDNGLQHIAALLPWVSAQTPGAGAAGGLGFGVLAFLGGELRPGVDLLLEQVRFGQLLQQNDLVVTGEGRMDAQTLQGKAPVGVLRRAQAAGVPVIGICGCVGEDVKALYDAGFADIFPASGCPNSLEELKKTCREDLARAARRAAKKYLHTPQK